MDDTPRPMGCQRLRLLQRFADWETLCGATDGIAAVILFQVIEKSGNAEYSRGGAKSGLIGKLRLRKIRTDGGELRSSETIFSLAEEGFA